MTTINTGARYDTGPTIAIAVKDHTVAWNDGHFVGDQDVVTFAEHMASGEVEMHVFNQVIKASYTDPLGALAAMAGYWPGRVIVTEAPEEVLEAIQMEPYLGYVNTEDGDTIISDHDELDDGTELVTLGGDA